MIMKERICKHCGNIFNVDSRKEFKTENRRILCDKCIESLSKEERFEIYQKNSKEKHSESRECLNCGNIFLVKQSKKSTSTSRKRLFCDICNKTLTDYQKKKIKMEKIPEFRENLLQSKRDSYKRNIIHNIWKRAKTRAIKYNLEFNIEESDIVIPEMCPLLNIPIILGDKDNYEQSPSLDRIDNNKGYIKGNIWIISKKANSMKNSANPEELNVFIQNIIRYSLNNTEQECIESKDKEL